MAWVSTAVAVGSTALSLFGANENKKSAQKSMAAQATADTASRVATANSMIASVHSQNAKALQLERNVDIMRMQGKADGVMRADTYNEMAATAMVMGAASGRVFGEGSMQAIMDKSSEDYMWDKMWAKNSLEISEAAVFQDIENVFEAGATSLMLGTEQLEVARLGSMAGQANTAAAAQQAFNNTLVGVGQNYLNTYGSTHINSLFDL